MQDEQDKMELADDELDNVSGGSNSDLKQCNGNKHLDYLKKDVINGPTPDFLIPNFGSPFSGDANSIVLHYTGNASDEDGVTAKYCKISSAGKVTAHFNSF